MIVKGMVGLFLGQMKSILEQRDIIFVEREASMRFMAERGMSRDDLQERLFALCSKDCFDGPEPDRDARYEDFTVAEFSPIWDSEKVYLKISICSERVLCKCLSVKPFAERGE